MPKQYLNTNNVARIIAVDQEYTGKLQHAVESRTEKDVRPISNPPQEDELGRGLFKKTLKRSQITSLLSMLRQGSRNFSIPK